MQVPTWLTTFVVDSLGTRHAGCRARHALSTIYTNIQEYYPNTSLKSILAWQRSMTRTLFAGWCRHTTLNYTDDYWLYKIVRILARINGATPYDLPSRGKQKIRIRLCQHAERLADGIIHQLKRVNGVLPSGRDIGCIRKFVATYPLWYTHQLSSINQKMLLQWIHTRMPAADKTSRQHMILVVLQILRAYNNSVQLSGIVADRTESQDCLIRLASNNSDIPVHICVFFSHFFDRPCNNLVSVFNKYLDGQRISGVYRYQIWDVLKTLLFDMSVTCHKPLSHTLKKIDAASLKQWLANIVQRSSQSVARRYRIALKHIIASNVLGQQPILVTDVACRVVPAAPVRHDTYSDDDVKRLQSACLSHFDRLLLNLLVQTGLRSTAVRNLKVVNFVGQYGMAFEKGKKWHTFPISLALQRYREAYLQDGHKTGSEWLFPDFRDADHCMTASQIRRWLQKLAARAQVRGAHVTLHSFRRYVVTTLLVNGNDMHKVMKYIGHKHPSTTVGYWCTQPDTLVRLMKIPWQDSENSEFETAAQRLNKRARELLALQQRC